MPILGQGADPVRRRMETEVNRPVATAIAITAKHLAVNRYRLGMLGLNLGLWTLVVVIARALYA